MHMDTVEKRCRSRYLFALGGLTPICVNYDTWTGVLFIYIDLYEVSLDTFFE